MILAGIFVGGRARRMGGKPKGLLVAPTGETIVARWRRMFHELGIPVVLVGESLAYGQCGLEHLDDDVAAKGPLAGLLALLEHARTGAAIAVASDMPNVSRSLVERLVNAPPASVIAASRRGRWEPFFARYEVPRVLPVARARAERGLDALQGLLDECGAAPLPLHADEELELDDWDSPEDMIPGH